MPAESLYLLQMNKMPSFKKNSYEKGPMISCDQATESQFFMGCGAASQSQLSNSVTRGKFAHRTQLSH